MNDRCSKPHISVMAAAAFVTGSETSFATPLAQIVHAIALGSASRSNPAAAVASFDACDVNPFNVGAIGTAGTTLSASMTSIKAAGGAHL
jgi:hypothetical protein